MIITDGCNSCVAGRAAGDLSAAAGGFVAVVMEGGGEVGRCCERGDAACVGVMELRGFLFRSEEPLYSPWRRPSVRYAGGIYLQGYRVIKRSLRLIKATTKFQRIRL